MDFGTVVILMTGIICATIFGLVWLLLRWEEGNRKNGTARRRTRTRNSEYPE